MRAGLPDPALFPAAAWRGRVADAIAADHRPQYSDPAGLRSLRHAIAHWISRSRSVIADEDAVVITCGSQHALDLLVGEGHLLQRRRRGLGGRHLFGLGQRGIG